MTAIIDPRDRRSVPPLNVSAGMANRPWPRPPEPENPPRTLLSEPTRRRFDAKLGCWIAEPPRIHEPPRNRRPFVPLPASRGRTRFDVFDTATGARFGSIRADTPRQALTLAHEFSRANGGSALDVYVREAR